MLSLFETQDGTKTVAYTERDGEAPAAFIYSHTVKCYRHCRLNLHINTEATVQRGEKVEWKLKNKMKAALHKCLMIVLVAKTEPQL